MNNQEVIEQLKENFPILKKIEKDIQLSILSHTEGRPNELMLEIEYTNYPIDQNDCLQLSQLFALLATAFEEVNDEDE